MSSPLLAEFQKSIIDGDWLPNTAGMNRIHLSNYIHDPTNNAKTIDKVVAAPLVRERYGAGKKMAWQIIELKNNPDGLTLAELEDSEPELTELIERADAALALLNEATLTLKAVLLNRGGHINHTEAHHQKQIAALKEMYEQTRAELNASVLPEEKRERKVA